MTIPIEIRRDWVRASPRRAEAHVRQHAVEPARQIPGRRAREAKQHRDEQQPDQEGVQQHGDAEDHAHLLRRQGAREGEGEEDRDHHRAGGEDHAPRVGEAADHRLCGRRPRRPSALSPRRAGRRCSPSRSRRSSRRRRPAPQASRKPCDSKPSRPARWPSWKISFAIPKAAPVASRLVTTPIAAASGAWKASSSSRKPRPGRPRSPRGVFAASAASRSWFSAAGPPIRAARGELRAEAIDRRAELGARGVAGGDGLDQRLAVAARLGRQ